MPKNLDNANKNKKGKKMLKKYKIMGMSIFEKLVISIPEFEANRLAMDEFIDRLATQHINNCEKHGFTTSLDKVYIEEVSKYYSAVTGAPVKHFREKLLILLPKYQLTDKKIEDNRAITYPTFAHNKKKYGAIEHIPTITAIVLDGANFTYLQENNCSRIDTSEGMISSMNNIYQSITDYYMQRLNIDHELESVVYKAIEDKITSITDEDNAISEEYIKKIIKRG